MDIKLTRPPVGFTEAALATRLSMGAKSLAKSDTTNDQLGQKDLALLLRLALAGDGHAKALRLITVHFWFKASLNFCLQWDTYRVGEAHVSSSKMHTLLLNPITPDLFEGEIKTETLTYLEETRLKGKAFFSELLANLPSSFKLERIGCTNYQTIRRIYLERKEHKLPEWRAFCLFVESLPYPELMIQRRKKDILL